jgi:hypothetical protein
MKTLTIILLIAANSLLAAPPAPTPSPPPAQTLTYSGGIDSNCTSYGQGSVIKGSPGTIITIHASGEIGSGPRWLLIFNKTTAPISGDVPAIALLFLQPNTQNVGSGVIDRDYLGGLPMTTGISWAISQSPTVLTPDCLFVTLTVTYQ